MRASGIPSSRRRGVGRGGGREDDPAAPVERSERELHPERDARVGGAQLRVGGQSGVVGAGERQPEHPAGQPRDDAGGPGRADVQQPVAPLGQRVDDRRHARDADAQAGIERDLDLRDGRQAAVDVRVAADHLDLEARHAALADLVERARDAVHAADAVGHERDAHRLASARGQPALLAPEERRGGRVGDRGHAGLEQLERGAAEVGRRRRVRGRQRGRRRHQLADRDRELALVAAARAALQPGVGEVVGLQVRDQVAVGQVELDRGQPGAQQRAGVLGAELGAAAPCARAGRAAAAVRLAHHALDDPQHRARVGRRAGGPAAERPHGQRHRVVRPAGGAAVVAVRLDAPGADVGEQLRRRRGARGLGVRAPDVDARRGRRCRRSRSRRASRRRPRPGG